MATVLNMLLDRVQELMQGVDKFLTISHMTYVPLTRMRGHIETLEDTKSKINS